MKKKNSLWKESKKEKITLKKVTIGFLDCLLGLAEGFAIIGDKKAVYQVAYGHFERKLTVEEISKWFYDLRRRGYIEVEKNSRGKESYIFTTKAKLTVLDKIAKRIESDEKFYFISFDIPEYMRRNRDLFRRAIKRLGFCEVQKSFWVCNKNVGEFVEMAAEEYGVAKYVAYVISDITNVNENLREIIGKKLS